MAVHRIVQLGFSAFAIDSEKTDRLIFMAQPDEFTARRISNVAHELKCKYRLRGKLLRPERLHVSLLHIQDYYEFPDDVADRAKEAASGIVFPPIEIVFDRAMSFSGSYAQVLFVGHGVAELTVLRKTLALAMAKAGIKSSCRLHFKPHLTLLYDEHLQIEEAIEPTRWTVNRFALIDSLVGKGRYKELGRWPLKGRFPVRSVSSPPEKIAPFVG
jgi:2'-5' RNA ligase